MRPSIRESLRSEWQAGLGLAVCILGLVAGLAMLPDGRDRSGQALVNHAPADHGRFGFDPSRGER